MAINRVPIGVLVAYLYAGLKAKHGYIMGSYGQDPKSWKVNSWWFTQYTDAKQRAKALYWREHARAVHDCNGIAEGCYLEATGVNINARARNNYATWCDPKGTGKIPNSRKVPGAAVFIHNGEYVSHVGYLLEPVDKANPSGDWWVCEAKGVMDGWVKTRLNSRGWNRWGWMTKYYNYAATGNTPDKPEPVELGHRTLKQGMVGDDVKELQASLISLNFSCGKWGADGEFGSATTAAVRAFQSMHGLEVDGIVGEKTFAKLNDLLPESGEDPAPTPEQPATVTVTGGTVYVRTAPGTHGMIFDVVRKGDKLVPSDETAAGWRGIIHKGERVWITEKYTEVA